MTSSKMRFFKTHIREGPIVMNFGGWVDNSTTRFCWHKCLSHALSQSAVSSHRSTKTREVTDQSQLPYYELAEEDGGTNGRNVQGQSCRLFFEFLCCARRFFSKELFFSSSQRQLETICQLHFEMAYVWLQGERNCRRDRDEVGA